MTRSISLALIVICVLGISVLNAQDTTDKERAGLLGPVKSVDATAVEFTIRDGKTEPRTPLPRQSTSYNPAGNILEQTTYSLEEGKILEKLIYKYDTSGRSIGYEEYSTAQDKSLMPPRKHIYVLDERGDRIEYTVLSSDGSLDTRFIYEYDAKGNKIGESVYYHTGQFGGKTAFTFDAKGNQVGQMYAAPDGTRNRKNVSTFDEKGHRIEWLGYESEDKLRYKIVFAYDDKGRIVKEETFGFNARPNELPPSHGPRPGKVEYVYDDRKRTKEVVTYGPSGSIEGRIIYAYDEKGSEIGLTTFRADGTLNDMVVGFYDDISNARGQFLGNLAGQRLFEIEYDSNGNWTKKTYLVKNSKDVKPQAYKIEQRAITYY